MVFESKYHAVSSRLKIYTRVAVENIGKGQTLPLED